MLETHHNESFDLPPRSYSRVPSRFYSLASHYTFSRAFSQSSYEPNHRSYGFGSRENCFEHRRFGYDTHSHRGDRFPRMPDFPAGGSYTHFEPRHLDDPCFSHHGSRPTQSNGEVKKIVKTSSSRMVKCCIYKIYLTNPSTEPLTPSCPM
jgi:hypothetical protein